MDDDHVASWHLPLYPSYRQLAAAVAAAAALAGGIGAWSGYAAIATRDEIRQYELQEEIRFQRLLSAFLNAPEFETRVGTVTGDDGTEVWLVLQPNATSEDELVAWANGNAERPFAGWRFDFPEGSVLFPVLQRCGDTGCTVSFGAEAGRLNMAHLFNRQLLFTNSHGDVAKYTLAEF